MTKQFKTVASITAAIAIISGVSYAIFKGDNRHELNFTSNGNISTEGHINAQAACKNLNTLIIENFTQIINKGENDFKYQEWISNIKTNADAMKMNRCDKDDIYTFIQSKYSINDEMYYKLQNLIE